LDDEAPPVGSSDPAICGLGKACVRYEGACQCAQPCSSAVAECPTGDYACIDVDFSETGQSAGLRCVRSL
jgi:hypothetical protein